jgi:hypothetical protein
VSLAPALALDSKWPPCMPLNCTNTSNIITFAFAVAFHWGLAHPRLPTLVRWARIFFRRPVLCLCNGSTNSRSASRAIGRCSLPFHASGPVCHNRRLFDGNTRETRQRYFVCMRLSWPFMVFHALSDPCATAFRRAPHIARRVSHPRCGTAEKES